ncbi:MAG TPA: RodZ domain-containing protein [Bacillota bacterium]
MKEIGEKLRKAREMKNISLKEIQEITKIRLRYLEAIESGNLEIIPGEVYRKGFLTNYANAVGLDSEEIISEYNKLLKARETPPPVVDPVPENELTQERLDETGPQEVNEPLAQRLLKLVHKYPVPLIAAIGTIVSGICILLVVNGIFKTQPLTTRQQPLSQQEEPGVSSRAREASLPVTSSKKDQAATTVQQIYPAPITVYAEFSDKVWVQVKADGQFKYLDGGVTFDAKSPKQLWTANSELVLRIGNPAGLRLTLNGKDLGPLGEAWNPKTITLTVNGMVESE